MLEQFLWCFLSYHKMIGWIFSSFSNLLIITLSNYRLGLHHFMLIQAIIFGGVYSKLRNLERLHKIWADLSTNLHQDQQTQKYYADHQLITIINLNQNDSVTMSSTPLYRWSMDGLAHQELHFPCRQELTKAIQLILISIFYLLDKMLSHRFALTIRLRLCTSEHCRL